VLLHGIRRVGDGRYRVRLGAHEHDLLRGLPAQLRPLLAGEQDVVTPQGHVSDRLFPNAYEDPLDELEYREMVGSALSSDRLKAVDDFAATLERGSTRRGSWSVELDAEEADAWLSALNDTRLTLAMVVGITDESAWSVGPDRNDPSSVALHWLGWLQEQLLAALAGTLEDD
jgi:hypothetical protein